MAQHPDPHERPPDEVRAAYKEYQRMKPALRWEDDRILDFGRGLTESQRRSVRIVDRLESHHLAQVFGEFEGCETSKFLGHGHASSISVYEHSHVPGRPSRFLPAAGRE